MLEWLADGGAWAARRLAVSFLMPSSRDSVLALGSGWLIGLFAFRYYFGREGFSLGGYLRHAFPARVYRSRSFAVDVQVFLFDRLLAPMRWVAKVVSVTLAASVMAGGLERLFGPAGSGELGTGGTIVLAALLFLAFDLGTYITHRLSHQVPVLWAFHRLHHSAEELNPLTLSRKHPVYTLLGVMIDCVTVAPLQALVLYAFGGVSGAAVAALANTGFVLFAYCAASLRHTHIWLSYGPVLERVLVSPALHQIHHSRAPRHFDRNFGEVLSVWDWMFGSLYLPRGREELSFGIAGEERQPHPTLAAALLEPFGYAWRVVRKPRPIIEADVAPVPDQPA